MTDVKIPWESAEGSSDIDGFAVVGDDLYIMFKRGTAYVYYDVPPDIIEGFREARSKGRFVGAYLKRQYRCERLPEAQPLQEEENGNQ